MKGSLGDEVLSTFIITITSERKLPLGDFFFWGGGGGVNIVLGCVYVF